MASWWPRPTASSVRVSWSAATIVCIPTTPATSASPRRSPRPWPRRDRRRRRERRFPWGRRPAGRLTVAGGRMVAVGLGLVGQLQLLDQGRAGRPQLQLTPVAVGPFFFFNEKVTT